MNKAEQSYYPVVEQEFIKLFELKGCELYLEETANKKFSDTSSGLRGVRRYSYSNWDVFFLIGALPVIVLWGIIWIVRGFRTTRNKST